MKKLILIDSNALVHRAFHALPPSLTSPKGVLTNAVYGFTSVLLKMLKDLKPDYIAATYDLAGPTFRHEEFEEYKAHREKAPDELYNQIPMTKNILEKFGIPIYEKPGFEADDLIGTLAEVAKKTPPAGGLQVIIVTGDLDTLQLVDKDRVVVFTLRKGLTDTIIYDEKGVRERYGLNPDQVTDYKGLKGDPSDNIPGVPGIGEKTASALIQTFGNIEGLYKAISNFQFPISKKQREGIIKPLSEKLIQKLQENKDQAFFSKKLATIIRNVEIDFSLEKTDWKANLDYQGIEKLFKELGFFSLIKRLGESGVIGQEETYQASLIAPPETESSSFRHCSKKEDIKNALVSMGGLKEFALDIQDDYFIFGGENKECFGFDLNNLTGTGSEVLKLRQTFSSLIENPSTAKVGHDLKLPIKKFLKIGVSAKGLFFDTKIAAYLLKPDRKDYDLGLVYLNQFNEDLRPDRSNRISAIWRLKKVFEEKMKAESLVEVFETIEMPLVSILAEMELFGIRIDVKMLKKLSQSTNKELSKLESKIYRYAGTKFNINSPQQLKEIIFEKLKMSGKIRKTAGGALSTAAGELEKLSEQHPIIDLILKYRELQKLKTTYIDPFPELIDPKTERIHTTLNQTGTVTGRLSSQDPNLQNIPVKTELGQEFRRSFIASPKYKLVSLDYSQLELRIAAHISGDKKMTAAFKRGEDIHTRTAAEIFEVDPDKVTPSMRREAKAMNFGLLYGMGITGFQRASGVSKDRAREFIDRYMTEFDGVAQYMESMRTKARKDGYVETIFGRKRYLPEIRSGIPQLMSQAERMAINMPVQGTEADLLKLAMIKIEKLINSDYQPGDVKMLLQIHDELLFEIKDNLAEKAGFKIKNIMENIYKLNVPLTVDLKCGYNWVDMAPL